MTLSKPLSAVAALGLAVCSGLAPAADPPAANPDEDALTCEQIYALGAAESHRAQLEREGKAAAIGRQMQANQALLTTLNVTGGAITMAAPATIPALTAAAAAAQVGQVQLADEMLKTAAPQANPREEHLKELWTRKNCELK
jgi:hypothetical protein